jgi:glutamine amidotransferase
MCELLGMSANTPTDICFSFTGLMERGGRTGPHRDGWGVVFYEGKGIREFRDPSPGVDSEIARLVKQYPIKSNVVISHIRQANAGRVCLENTHPFTRELWGRQWTFAHNGQLKGVKKLPLGRYLPVGTTDSEYAFCWLLERIRRRFSRSPTNSRELGRFIKTQCDKLEKLGVFNMLLCDGKYLYGYCSNKLCWITRRAPFGQASLTDTEVAIDFHQETTPNDIVTVLATTPLTGNENWNCFARKELVVFKDGLVYQQLK